MRPEAIPALTSLRGLAAWWVVLYHFRDALPAATPAWLVGVLAQGYLAVDLFFILSGFVLGLNYGDRFRRGIAGSAGFIWLRLARIYPLHAVMMAAFLLNPLAIALFSQAGDRSAYGWDYFLLSLVLLQNWGFTSHLAWNVPAWSISTEFFAYLLFPALAFAMGRLVLSARIAIVAMAGLLVVLALAAMSLGHSLDDNIPAFGLARCCLQFMLGMLVWRLRAMIGFATPRRSNAALVAAALPLLAYALLPVPDFVLVPAAFLLVVFALADRELAVAPWLTARWLEWLGLISYSTYLSHFFIKSWVKFLLVRPGIPDGLPLLVYLGAVGLASVLLYRLVEVPGRRWMRDLAPGRAPLAKTALDR